jgi:hypothetical protein
MFIYIIKERSGDIKRYRFAANKLSSELGLFIIKIALCQASPQENVLSDISTSDGINYQCVLRNMYNFAKLYDSNIEILLGIIYSNYYNIQVLNYENFVHTKVDIVPYGRVLRSRL